MGKRVLLSDETSDQLVAFVDALGEINGPSVSASAVADVAVGLFLNTSSRLGRARSFRKVGRHWFTGEADE